MSGSFAVGRTGLGLLLFSMVCWSAAAQAPETGGGTTKARPDAKLRIEPAKLEIAPGQVRRVTVFVTGRNGFTGPVEVVAEGRQGISVQPRVRRIETLPAQFEVTVTAQPAPPNGREKGDAIFVVRMDGDPRSLDTARLRTEGGEAAAPQVRQPPPRNSGAPLPDSGAPVPPLPQQFGAAANAVQDTNQHFDGLARSLSSGEPPIDPQRAAQQVAMLKFYDALVSELRNPSSFAMSSDGLEVDPAILAAMIEDSGVLERDRRLRQEVASLGLTPLALVQMSLEAESSGFPKLKAGQPVDWNSAQNKVERLILQIKLARAAEGFQSYVTGPSRQAVDALNDAVDKLEEKLGGDKTPGRAKRALRQLMIATAAVTLADVVARAGIAFLPNEITAFYVEVNGMRRNEGDPPISIKKGQTVPIRALLETKSPGGQVVTPSEVIGWVYGAASKHPKYDDMIDRVLGLDKAAISDQMKKEVRDEFLKKIETIWTRVTGMPAIREWLTNLDKSWDVKPFYNKPVEVNSNNVLQLESRSKNLLEIVQSGPATDRKYAFKGLSKGDQAGYHVALKKDLIEEMNTMSKAQLGRFAVVNVVDDERFAVHPNAGKPCAWNGQNPGVVVPDGPCIIMVTGECGCPH